jgi:ABC-2 type transport system permease protein
MAEVAGNAAAELAVAVAWSLVAAATFRHLAERGRRDGSIEFGS